MTNSVPLPGTRKVAVMVDTEPGDYGLATALEQICERGVPGYEIDVIGSRGPIGAYHLLHLCNVGSANLEALLIARAVRLPVVASFHAGLGASSVLRDGYADCDVVLSPSAAADEVLREVGVADGALARWHGGVDPHRFHPARYSPEALPPVARARLNVLHVGRLEHGWGLELLAEAFLIAHDHDPRLHLLLAGRGPAELALRERLGPAVTIASGLDREVQAELYASSDLFVFADPDDPFGASILEAQASGLPVLALDTGAGHELIDTGRNGCLVPADASALAAAIRGLARRATLRERLTTCGLLAATHHAWDRSLAQLAGAYGLAIARSGALDPRPERLHAA
jgi:glycosyltransferase involved in cell wall biosynthesis